MIHQVAHARRQQRDLSVFESSYHLPTVYHARRRLHTLLLIAEHQASNQVTITHSTAKVYPEVGTHLIQVLLILGSKLI